MATRALPGFVAVYRAHQRETRSLVPTGRAIAQLLRAALLAFIDSRMRKADREIARVLRARRGPFAPATAAMQFRGARFEP